MSMTVKLCIYNVSDDCVVSDIQCRVEGESCIYLIQPRHKWLVKLSDFIDLLMK